MLTSPTFEIGSPQLKRIWVDPNRGDDARTGADRASALKTVGEAWKRVPPQPDGHGREILLCPGRYATNIENQILLMDRYGSRACPIIIRPADAPLSAELPQTSVRRASSVYFIDLLVTAGPNEFTIPSENLVLHFASVNDVLVRRVTARGIKEDGHFPAIAFKANQCLRVYVEDCEFSHADYNTIDYVAVHYGHIVRNRLHDVGAECLYVKGGSAYHLIAHNELWNSRNHGILAGQATGFQYMVPPWLHYEAYDIKAVNNVIHDAGGGLAVCGGYNVLMAYNTCYRIGSSRDTIVVGLGGRGWNGPRPEKVDGYFALGGWCDQSGGENYNIPNRNVQICNNILFNPDGFESRCAHIGISGPLRTNPRSNLPELAQADEGLAIRGNVIWNGGADKPLLDDVENMYHLAARPTAEAAQLRRENAINALRPELRDPARGDFRPVDEGNLRTVVPVDIPDFGWNDAPTRPAVPAGNGDNQVVVDRAGKARRGRDCVGAFGFEVE